MKVQEINMLNIKHNDLVDKYYIDSEQNKLLKKENYLLKDTIFKQQYIFKSTMSTLIDIIDSLVFKDFSESNSVKLKNNVFENSAEALKAYNTEGIVPLT
jgi:tRNA(Ile2) C34 agmatinyltransferase TiaS